MFQAGSRGSEYGTVNEVGFRRAALLKSWENIDVRRICGNAIDCYIVRKLLAKGESQHEGLSSIYITCKYDSLFIPLTFYTYIVLKIVVITSEYMHVIL